MEEREERRARIEGREWEGNRDSRNERGVRYEREM